MISTNLSVTQAEAREMLDFFANKKTKLIQDNKQIFSKLDEYEGMITKLTKIISSNDSVYPAGSSWNTRIRYVLGLNPKGLTSKQIVDAIAIYEDIEKGSDAWKDIYKGVAPSLSAGDKIYRKIPNTEGNTVYSLLQ